MHRPALQRVCHLCCFSFSIAEKEQSQVINTFQTLVFCKSSGARELPAGSLVVLAELFQSCSRFWFSGSIPANTGKRASDHTIIPSTGEINTVSHRFTVWFAEIYFNCWLRFLFSSWDICNFFLLWAFKMAEVNLSVLPSVWMGTNAWGVLSSTHLNTHYFIWNCYCIRVLFDLK